MTVIDDAITTSELRCTIHGFVTRDIDEWNKHLEEPGHYSVGSGDCVICGEEYAFTLEDRIPATLLRRGELVHPQCRETQQR